jgi:amidophosphoribosyltransferase
MTVAEVRDFIEADSLGYLSLEGMFEACGLPAETSCAACWTGDYPTRINARAETMYAREHEAVPSD